MEKGKGGKQYLIITEIPYTMIGANIGKFLNDVAALVDSKKQQILWIFQISLPKKESGLYWS